MPTWGKILLRLQEMQKTPPPDLSAGTSILDYVRRDYLATHHRITGRNVILYASKWTQDGGDPIRTMMTIGDMDGFMNAVHGLEGDNLDLILHLPGGHAEAAERVGGYLRTRFRHIRVFVPLAAMSAATMLACVADEIVMGKHSHLGPIDPQFVLGTESGRRAMPAYAIIEQFARAKSEIVANPSVTHAWLPILRQFDQALLIQCEFAAQLAREMVTAWLQKYMLAGNASLAADVGAKLADHRSFLSHSRAIDRDEARKIGLNIGDLETDPALQDAVLSIYHAVSHTFSGAAAVKIVENHKGAAWVQQMVTQQVTIPMQIPLRVSPPQVPPPAPTPSPPPTSQPPAPLPAAASPPEEPVVTRSAPQHRARKAPPKTAATK